MKRRQFLRDSALLCATGPLLLRDAAVNAAGPPKKSVPTPPLAEICARLGYAGTDVSAKGETAAPQWSRAMPGMVRAYPLAAWGMPQECAVGWYLSEKPDKRNTLWKIDRRREREDNPPTESKGKIAFDPGEKPFGFWLSTKAFADEFLYTDDARNNTLVRFAGVPHRAHFYAAVSSNGSALPYTYLVGWDYTATGGFQDVVMVVENVRPV